MRPGIHCADVMLRDRGTKDAIDRIFTVEDDAFASLAAAGRLDPRRDFVQIDMRGWPLAGQDLRGFDFTGSDLRHTGIEAATLDGTTVLTEVRLDRSALRRLRNAGMVRPPEAPRAAEPYTMVRFPDLSDAELLDRDFVIREPETLPGLTFAPPPRDQWLTYEGRYVVASSVRCAFKHPHKRGYAFRDELGRRYLIGNACGATHLGMGKWKEFTKQRELLEDRGSYLRTYRDLKLLFADALPWIVELRDSTPAKEFDRARALLKRECPSLVGAVQDASHSGFRLALQAKERDFGAEERARERKGAEAGEPAPVIWKTTLREVGELRGRTVFTARMALREELGHLVRIVENFLAFSPKTTRAELVATTRNARVVVQRILAVVGSTRDFESFFEPENLALVSRWANENRFDAKRYETVAGILRIRPLRGSAFDIIKPHAVADPQGVLPRLEEAAVGWRLRKATPKNASAGST